MKTEYKHIKFILDRRITLKDEHSRYWCRNKNEKQYLGYVFWYDGWNQYVYADNLNAMYSKSCLLDIADFLDQLNNLKE